MGGILTLFDIGYNLGYRVLIAIFFVFVLSLFILDNFGMEVNALLPNPHTESETPIKHVVVISQGARSFDNYFGTFPGANGIPNNLTLPLNPFVPPSVEFSIAVWFNSNVSLPSKGFLVNKGGLGSDAAGQNMNYAIWMNRNGTLMGGFETINGTDHFVTSDSKYNDGKWHQVIVTYDGREQLIMFVDGSQTSSSNTGGAIPDTDSVKPIILGSNPDRNDNFFSGKIDELRIWNRTLADTEISEAYKNNQYNTDKEFVYLSFDQDKADMSNSSSKLLELNGVSLNGSLSRDVKTNLPEDTKYLKPFHLEDTKTDNPYYNSKSYKMSFNQGLMNGFLSAQPMNRGNAQIVLGYYNNNELPYYWDFASEYVLLDNFFTPTMETGLNAESYLYTAMSANHQQNISYDRASGTNYTIFNELQNNAIPWKIYAEDSAHMLNPTNNETGEGARNILSALPQFLANGTLKSNIVGLPEYFRDLKTDEFPAVAYIVAPSIQETAPKDVSVGQEFVSALVLALMKSKHWNDSMFIITFRESGGWYDHVRPPLGEDEPYGFRIPTLVISPYSKKGYVDSTLYDTTSILKFIEYNYNISSIAKRDADANNLLNAFDFTKQPRSPIEVQEISREKLIIKSDDVSGINAVYVFSLLAPLSVTLYWYFKTRKIKKNVI